MKTEAQRQRLIQILKRTPIVQIACEKAGISRATYYRWLKKNKKFKEEAEEALLEGSTLVNDMAESQLIAGIKDQNMTAIIFWLKHHHKAYKTKIEVSGKIKTVDEILTTEQKSLIQKAIKLASANHNVDNLT